MIRKCLAILAVAALLVSCVGTGSGSSSGSAKAPAAAKGKAATGKEAAVRTFPVVQVPMVYSDDSEAAAKYAAEHYWDAFFAVDGPTDPEHVLGVPDAAVEEALAGWLTLLGGIKADATPDAPAPLRSVQGWISAFFGKTEAAQKRDTTSHVFLRLTEMVSKYLYDPNSPYRDEDMYLPYARAAAASPCTPDNLRPAYAAEARICSTNAFGEKVPDIRYANIHGVKGRLYDVNAEYIMLFFSNPGCNACKEIISDVDSRPYIDKYIAEKRLAIVNVYVDEEIAKWREYVPKYPTNWINGYDYTFSLRNGGEWVLRAIPSLYLLDSNKRVILKDAPTEKVLSYLDRI